MHKYLFKAMLGLDEKKTYLPQPQLWGREFLEYSIYENVRLSWVVQLAQQLTPLEELRYIDIFYNVGVSVLIPLFWEVW